MKLQVAAALMNLVIYAMTFICSSFADIFDVDHFISVLKDEVRIVRELPTQYAWSTREYYATGIRATRIKTAPVHASTEWYLENVLPVIQRFVASKPNDQEWLHCRVLENMIL